MNAKEFTQGTRVLAGTHKTEDGGSDVDLIHTSEVASLVCEHLKDCCLLDDRQRARNYRIQLEACCKELAVLLP